MRDLPDPRLRLPCELWCCRVISMPQCIDLLILDQHQVKFRSFVCPNNSLVGVPWRKREAARLLTSICCMHLGCGSLGGNGAAEAMGQRPDSQGGRWLGVSSAAPHSVQMPWYSVRLARHQMIRVFAGRGRKQPTRTNSPRGLRRAQHILFLSLALFSLIRLTCRMHRDIYKILYNTDLVELFNTY
ncbi:uncharacterized protein LOC120651402 isoform X1 [Panicum virgatum]|uniref:uncharacterized protein LOC120651402 isoform X1 n=1 Tax=Panicum virgatum TaxID=38727 RepID=UPI0019D67C94|nr:uncharacterized protein LOC120651402 isoform X1 [Panicum virgatum]